MNSMKLITLRKQRQRGHEPGKGSVAAVLAGSGIADFQKVLLSSSSYNTSLDPGAVLSAPRMA